MGSAVTLKLNGETVRFSPDGKAALRDAIQVVMGHELPEDLWNGMKTLLAGIVGKPEERDFPGENSVTVVNSDGWSRICDWLIDHPYHTWQDPLPAQYSESKCSLRSETPGYFTAQ